MILLNKIDKVKEFKKDDIVEKLGMSEFTARTIHYEECSLKQGEGVTKAIKWLGMNMLPI